LDLAWTFGKSARHQFVIDHDIPRDDALDEPGVEIRLQESQGEAVVNLRRTAGQERSRMFELFGIGGVGGHDGLEISGVVGVKLPLNYFVSVHKAGFLWGATAVVNLQTSPRDLGDQFCRVKSTAEPNGQAKRGFATSEHLEEPVEWIDLRKGW
jgi:hypothetical protein